MKEKALVNFAELLRKQRQEYLNKFRKAEEGLEFIAEDRESELEESAQEERSARLLARLDDRTLRAVQEIDAAHQRILDGKYGVCESCGGAIAAARLRALPATRYCTDCEVQIERQAVAAAEEAETPSKTEIPPDLSLLDDAELAEVIREHLKEDGRVDAQELRIVCRKGVVHLSGAVPSSAECEILLQIVTDVLGIKEVVDRIQVEGLLWQREGLTKEKPPEVFPPGQEAAGTEDIVESSEEGTEFVAPAEPPPKEE